MCPDVCCSVKVPAKVQAALEYFEVISEVGANRGMTYARDMMVGINFAALREDARWHASMGLGQRLGWVMSHEAGHVLDHDQDFSLSKDWADASVLLDEIKTAAGKNALLDWALAYPLSVQKNAPREFVAQLLALYQTNEGILNEHLPQNAAWLRRALEENKSTGDSTNVTGKVGGGAGRVGSDARNDGPVSRGRATEGSARLDPNSTGPLPWETDEEFAARQDSSKEKSDPPRFTSRFMNQRSNWVRVRRCVSTTRHCASATAS